MKRDSWRPRLTTGQQGGDNTHTSYSWLRTEACTQTHTRPSLRACVCLKRIQMFLQARKVFHENMYIRVSVFSICEFRCLCMKVWQWVQLIKKPQSKVCIGEHLVNEKLKYLYLVPQREENIILLKCLDNWYTGNIFHCFRNLFVYNYFWAKWHFLCSIISDGEHRQTWM